MHYSIFHSLTINYEQIHTYTYQQQILMATFLCLSMIIIIRNLYQTIFRALPNDISTDNLPFISFLYSNILPDRAASRLLKPLTHKKIPKLWRRFIFKSFGKIYPVEWNYFKKDLTKYHTFHEFFTRCLEHKRIMDDSDLISPVDGTVVAFGEVDPDTQSLEQIKGVTFKLKQFLYGYHSTCDASNTSRIKNLLTGNNKLYYAIIYLSPGDYHRFHSPADGIKIDCKNHIVGDLYPVGAAWLKCVPGLFSLNERMVMSGTWKEDLFFAYVPVGAFNIGSIHLKDDPYHITNQLHQDSEIWYKPTNKNQFAKKCIELFDDGEELIYDKGDEIGHFSFGSTVALIFEAPNFDFYITREQKIKFGDALGDIGLFV